MAVCYTLAVSLTPQHQEGDMPRVKKPKREKPVETTEQFIARVSKKGETRNGKRVRFGFTKRSR